MFVQAFRHELLKRKSTDTRFIVPTQLSINILLSVSIATAGRFALTPAIMWRCGQRQGLTSKTALTAGVIR